MLSKKYLGSAYKIVNINILVMTESLDYLRKGKGLRT